MTDVEKVALAIAKVIARRELAEQPKYQRATQFDLMLATTTMANAMAPQLHEEASAAISALREAVN